MLLCGAAVSAVADAAAAAKKIEAAFLLFVAHADKHSVGNYRAHVYMHS